MKKLLLRVFSLLLISLISFAISDKEYNKKHPLSLRRGGNYGAKRFCMKLINRKSFVEVTDKVAEYACTQAVKCSSQKRRGRRWRRKCKLYGKKWKYYRKKREPIDFKFGYLGYALIAKNAAERFCFRKIKRVLRGETFKSIPFSYSRSNKKNPSIPCMRPSYHL